MKTGGHRFAFAAAAALGIGWLSLGAAEDANTRSEPTVTITPRGRPGRTPDAQIPHSIRANVKVVLIPVTVNDLLDRPITGLGKDDFHLFEDNVEQKIVYLSAEDAPASVGLIFDASGSMRNKIETSVAAVEQFFQTTLPGDEFLLCCRRELFDS